jgi:hypothetical protein
MRRILNFFKRKPDTNRTVDIYGDVGGPPTELYSVAIALVLDDGQLVLSAGFLLAASPEQAKAVGMVTAFNAWKDKKIAKYYTRAQVLTPPVLEAVKSEYGLTDGLALWREELERET